MSDTATQSHAKSSARTRSHCDCGKPATVVLSGFKICERCYTLETDLDFRYQAPKEIKEDGQ